jgi:peptidoglycan hydrolase-like protein with peptidoglycan-binding domain
MTHVDVQRRRLLAAVALTIAAPALVRAGDMLHAPDTNPGWPRNLVRALQQRLAERGLEPGPIDGHFGPHTAAAIRRLQELEGLEPDGRISQAVLARVGLARPE